MPPVCSRAPDAANAYIQRMAKDPFKKSPEQKQTEAAEGMAAYRAKEAAANQNMLRLRAERLAREAEALSQAAAEPAPKPVKKKAVRK
jgi:hypothetical protein